MILPKQDLLERIAKEKLIEDAVDLKEQVQPASIDLTVEKVFSFSSKGQIDFDNKERKLSEVKELLFDSNGWLDLAAGSYKVQFKEKVCVPKDAAGISITRSSLLRCSCHIPVGFWDPGYCGRGENMLIVQNPFGIRIKKNSKIGQIIFVKLSSATSELYAGIHKNENI